MPEEKKVVLDAQKPLILRVNRALGTSLVEKRLVEPQQLEVANEQLSELLQSGELKQASVLGLLLRNASEGQEQSIIAFQAQTFELGLVDLTNYQLERSFDTVVDLAACWATRTIPYDQQEEFVFLATNFYLSEPVVKYWEGVYPAKKLIWSVTSTNAMIEALERLENHLASQPEQPSE